VFMVLRLMAHQFGLSLPALQPQIDDKYLP